MKAEYKKSDAHNRSWRLDQQARYPSSWPAMQRLSKARATAEKFRKLYPDSTYYADWRNHRPAPAVNRLSGIGRTSEGEFYGYKIGDAFDFVGNAHDITRISHTGWYTHSDNHSALLIGAVCKMRTARGIRYIPAAHETDADSVTYYLSRAVVVPRNSDESDHDAAKRECALIADGIAESDSKKMRAHNEAWQAGNEFASAGEELKTIRTQCRALIAELRTAAASGLNVPTVCKTLRDSLERMLSDADELRQKRARLIEDWSAGWRSEYRDSFNDGAECRAIGAAQ